jgi:hypothetical protein
MIERRLRDLGVAELPRNACIEIETTVACTP